MQDHLDDPTPPEGDRAAVAARAGRLRLRRRLAWTGAGTATTAVAVVAVVLAGQSGAPRRSVLSLASPSAAPSEPPSETASPSAVATPTSTASPAPEPVPVPAGGVQRSEPAATPSPTPCDDTKYEECPDGRPGYGEGDSLSTCRNRTSVPSGDAAADLGLGATATLVLPASVEAQGESTKPGPSGDLVVKDGGGQRLRVALVPDSGNDEDPNVEPGWDGLVKGAADHQDLGAEALRSTIYRDLEPGVSVTFPVYLETAECGDTQGDLDTPLPAGDYELGFDVDYHVEALPDVGPSPTAEPSPYEHAALGGTLHIS